MPPVTLQVKLLEMSKDPLTLLYVAYRQCYSAQWASEGLGDSLPGPIGRSSVRSDE